MPSFRFHIPNFFSRQETNGALYQYHEVAADETSNLVHSHQDQGDDLLHPGTGAESTQAWKHLCRKRRALVYLTFGLLGMGVLLPFNSIITPSEYFRSSFSHTSFSSTFSSWIIVSYNVVSILFGLHATATGGLEKSSPRRRIIVSSLFIIFALFTMALSTTVHLSSSGGEVRTHPTLYFYFTLANGFVLSTATAYLQNAVVALSTAFGGNGSFIGCMLAGQGIVGVGISIFGLGSAWSQARGPNGGEVGARAISPSLLATETQSPETLNEIYRAATLFFFMTMALMSFVLAVFVWLAKSDLYGEVMQKQVKEEDLESDSDVDDHEHHHHHPLSSSSHLDRDSLLHKVPGFHSLSPKNRASLLTLASVQSLIKWDCFAIAYIFIVTLSVFPTLTSLIQSVHTTSNAHVLRSLASPLLFVPFHFLLFNVSDLLGRTLPSVAARLAQIQSVKALVGLALARTVFVPLFMGCNVSNKVVVVADGNAGILRSSDLPFFALVLLFGLSNGLISTSVMIVGPSRAGDQAPLAATLLSFWLCIGLAIGSGLSFFTVGR
ncbi:hypothetical protein IE53DRAFT_383316 [Violaceomyces palustris]|uniref:Uncharacterized protein n=1 Tax=Violaceomyces palustris TaxID=1673888 RepID=A0ACD0P852_9BASI|nr:hypothetical protein IE53DRAFT_383316 [Violaceomyces palustris]